MLRQLVPAAGTVGTVAGAIGDVGSCTSIAYTAVVCARYTVFPSFVIMCQFGQPVKCDTNTGFALSRTSSTEKRVYIATYT